MTDETRPDGTLEVALARTESDADAAIKTARSVVSQLAKAKKAASVGALRELERGLDAAQELAGALRESIRSTRVGWCFDERPYLESGEYARELIELGRSRGVDLREQDERIVAFPSLVRILPADAAIEIDRKRQRQIRPSHVVEAFRAAQGRPPRFRADQFLEALLRAYRLVVAEQGREVGATVRLLDVYRILTVLPGSASAYSRQEFARDVYLLDESGVEQTRDGSRVSLPAATGTKGTQAITTVTREGSVKTYFGLAFRA
jgi:hypothetical protein